MDTARIENALLLIKRRATELFGEEDAATMRVSLAEIKEAVEDIEAEMERE